MTHFAGAGTTNFGGTTNNRGNWVPEIFSQKAQIVFRRSSVVNDITNNDYMGDIVNHGDTVNIIKEPDITVVDMSRGQELAATPLTDDQIVLVVDQAQGFRFDVDDIEDKFSHINWIQLATDRAAYNLRNRFDSQILSYMSDSSRVLAANVVNDMDEANVLDLSNADDLLNQITNLGVRMSLQDVPEEGRWLVMPHEAAEVLAKADSKLLNMDYNGGVRDLTNNPYHRGMLRGFNLYVTNNAPTYTSTGTGGTGTGRYVLMAGHMSAVSTAESITKIENVRSETKFADIIRGLHVYGRTLLRPEALSVAHVRFS